MAVVTSATDGGLLTPLRECAIAGANAQNGTNHRRMKSTPTRSRKGDMAADFAFSLVEVPSGMFIPTLLGVPWGHTRQSDGAETHPAKSIRPRWRVPRLRDDQRFAEAFARREPVPVSSATMLRMILRTCRAAASALTLTSLRGPSVSRTFCMVSKICCTRR
jgi:hypothetical protein